MKTSSVRCGDCVDYTPRPHCKRGSCASRPKTCRNNAVYPSSWACGRFKSNKGGV